MFEIGDAINRALLDEDKARFVQAAFIGWQLGAKVTREGEQPDEKYPFRKHLENLGLIERQATPEVKGKTAEEVKADTQRIFEKLKAMGEVA